MYKFNYLRLKKILFEKNIKPVQFAKMLNIHPSTVNLWLRGKSFPNRNMFEKICETLMVEASFFLNPESAQSNTIIHEQEAKYNISHYQKQIEDLKTQMLTMQNLINILAEKINKLESAHKN